MLETDREAIRQVKDDIEHWCARAEVDVSVQPTAAQKMKHYEAVYNAITRVTSETSVYNGYEVCEILYLQYQEILVRYLYKYNHLTIMSSSEEELCRAVTEVWCFYQTLMRWCMHAFGYLSRYYIPNNAKPSLRQTAVLIFWEHLGDRHASVISKVTQQLLMKCYADVTRYNEQISIAMELMSSLTRAGVSGRGGGKTSHHYHAQFDFHRDFMLPLLALKRQRYETLLAEWAKLTHDDDADEDDHDDTSEFTYAEDGSHSPKTINMHIHINDTSNSNNDSNNNAAVTRTERNRFCCLCHPDRCRRLHRDTVHHTHRPDTHHDNPNNKDDDHESNHHQGIPSLLGGASPGPYHFLCCLLTALSDEQRVSHLYLDAADETTTMRAVEETMVTSATTRTRLLEHRDGVVHALRVPHRDAVRRYFALLSRHAQGMGYLVTAMQRVIAAQSAALRRPSYALHNLGEYACRLVQLQHRYAQLTATCLHSDPTMTQAMRTALTHVFAGTVAAAAADTGGRGEVVAAVPVCECLAHYAHEVLLRRAAAWTERHDGEHGSGSMRMGEQVRSGARHSTSNSAVVHCDTRAAVYGSSTNAASDNSHTNAADAAVHAGNNVTAGDARISAADADYTNTTAADAALSHSPDELALLTEALDYVTDFDHYLTMSRGLLAERAARPSYMRAYRAGHSRDDEWAVMEAVRARLSGSRLGASHDQGSQGIFASMEKMLTDMEHSYDVDALSVWADVDAHAANTLMTASPNVPHSGFALTLLVGKEGDWPLPSSFSSSSSAVPVGAALGADTNRCAHASPAAMGVGDAFSVASRRGRSLGCSATLTLPAVLTRRLEHVRSSYMKRRPDRALCWSYELSSAHLEARFVSSSSSSSSSSSLSAPYMLFVNGVQASILFAMNAAISDRRGGYVCVGELLKRCGLTWEPEVRVALSCLMSAKLLLARRCAHEEKGCVFSSSTSSSSLSSSGTDVVGVREGQTTRESEGGDTNEARIVAGSSLSSSCFVASSSSSSACLVNDVSAAAAAAAADSASTTVGCDAVSPLQLQLDDVVALNDAFTSDTCEVCVYPPVVPMGAVSTGKKDTCESRLRETQKHACYACLVKLMKARRAMTHASLVSECQKQLPSGFMMDASTIKLRIEELIRRGFIERDGTNSSIYQFRM